MITSVDNCFHFYEPEGKLGQSKPPTIINRWKATIKVLYGSFFKLYGIVALIPTKKTECVTKGVYMHEILSDVKKKYCKIKSPISFNEQIVILTLFSLPFHSSFFSVRGILLFRSTEVH